MEITVNTWPVTYVYVKWELLLPYGISVLCALGCSCVGLQAFFVNDASYQNLLSAFLRATNDLEVRSQISENGKGSDPLPKALAKATVTVNGSHQRAELNSKGADCSDLELRLLSRDRSESVSVAHLAEAETATTDSCMHSREIEGTSHDDGDTDNRTLQNTTPEDGGVVPAMYLTRSRPSS